LLGGRTLTASEALRAGLVTRVLWPDRFQVELLPSLRAMSDQSSQVSHMSFDYNFSNKLFDSKYTLNIYIYIYIYTHALDRIGRFYIFNNFSRD